MREGAGLSLTPEEDTLSARSESHHASVTLARRSDFRYLEIVLKLRTWVLYGAIACVLVACGARGPRTPESAFERISLGVSNNDAETLFEGLDQHTRWSWMTIQKCHREAYDAVLSNFPDGPDKLQKLRYLEPAATAETPADIFATKMGARALAELKGRLPTGTPQFSTVGAEATLAALSGAALQFRLVEGRWGYSGFAAEAEDQKRRAIADLELIKTSATDYERARTLGNP